MLTAVYGGERFAESIATSGFAKLLARNIAKTEQFAHALCETGRFAGASAFLDQYHSQLAAGGVSLFDKSTFGWDVRPASTERIR